MTTSHNHKVTLRRLDLLPPWKRFRALCIANAALDAILMPDWEYRYFSYDGSWDQGEELASMRDGSGSHHFVVIGPAGVFIKGRVAGSPLNTPREEDDIDWRTEGLPGPLREYLREPAYDMQNMSFCLWSLKSVDGWRSGEPPMDGLLVVPLGRLDLLLDDPGEYRSWAEEYYERPLATEVVESFQALTPLSAKLLSEISPELSLAAVRDDLLEIGFPVAE